ncbi:MAG: cbb3-type cytochrome c oxidase subunit 3 [Alphaproteobacteria bacterium]|nr:MAG: cbb3-type cytochrome c oxidase subunit 3 [Alphaproteobacteria bacterium]
MAAADHGLTHFAHSWGLVYLVVLMLGAVVYAFWPGNHRKFDKAARAPLDDEAHGDNEDAS